MNKIKIIYLLFFLLLTGCTMNEIEEYSIVAGIGIDYNDGLYQVTYEIYKENNGETTSLTSIIKKGVGHSISSAVNDINNKIYQIPYLNHCLLIILSESIVEQKLEETINYLIHDVRIRSSCYIVTTEDNKASEILEVSQENKQVVSYNIFKKIDQKPNQVGIWNNCDFDYIMNEKIDKNGVLIIPIVKYSQDFDISNVTIITKNEKIKVMEEEVFVIQLFYNCVNEGLIKINDYYLYLKSLKSKITFNNNTIKIDLYIQLLSYDDLKNEEQKKELVTKLEEEMKLLVTNIFTKYQEMGVDAFGIYKHLQRFEHKKYTKIENEYDTYFMNLKLFPLITIDLLTSGLSEERI